MSGSGAGPSPRPPGRRIAVVGVSGTGKTTLAAALASRFGVAHLELDAVYHGPGWTPLGDDHFRARVAEAVAADGWVVDGNYSVVQEIVWSRASCVVWLDYPRWLATWRAVRRTAVRLVARTPLWNDNRERWQTVWRATHPIRWSWSQHGAFRQRYAARFADPRWGHLSRVRLDSPAAARGWLATLDQR